MFENRPTILTPEGSREIEEELKHGSPMTPERRATFDRMRQMAEVHRRSAAQEQAPVKTK